MEKHMNGVNLSVAHVALHALIKRLQFKNGFAWANNCTMGEELLLSRSYVSHLITDLVRAGYVYRHIERDEESGEVIYRQLVAFDSATDETAQAEKIRQMIEKREENADRNRLLHNARIVGIAPPTVLKAIITFGAERVDSALAIVKASTTVKAPARLFWAALRDGYKAGKRAKSWFNKVFEGAARRAVALPPPPNNKYSLDVEAVQQTELWQHIPAAVRARLAGAGT